MNIGTKIRLISSFQGKGKFVIGGMESWQAPYVQLAEKYKKEKNFDLAFEELVKAVDQTKTISTGFAASLLPTLFAANEYSVVALVLKFAFEAECSAYGAALDNMPNTLAFLLKSFAGALGCARKGDYDSLLKLTAAVNGVYPAGESDYGFHKTQEEVRREVERATQVLLSYLN